MEGKAIPFIKQTTELKGFNLICLRRKIQIYPKNFPNLLRQWYQGRKWDRLWHNRILLKDEKTDWKIIFGKKSWHTKSCTLTKGSQFESAAESQRSLGEFRLADGIERVVSGDSGGARRQKRRVGRERAFRIDFLATDSGQQAGY